MSENEQNELQADSSTSTNKESRSNVEAMPDVDQWVAERSSEASEGIPIVFSPTPDKPPVEEPPTEEQSPSPESQLPPEAQGEANGGPLGCCLGVMIGLLLSLAIPILSQAFASPLRAFFQGNLAPLVRILMVILAVVFAILCGYFGWKVGKRIYREYDPPVAKERKRRAKVKKA